MHPLRAALLIHQVEIKPGSARHRPQAFLHRRSTADTPQLSTRIAPP
jgi:hypothetical protein